MAQPRNSLDSTHGPGSPTGTPWRYPTSSPGSSPGATSPRTPQREVEGTARVGLGLGAALFDDVFGPTQRVVMGPPSQPTRPPSAPMSPGAFSRLHLRSPTRPAPGFGRFAPYAGAASSGALRAAVEQEERLGRSPTPRERAQTGLGSPLKLHSPRGTMLRSPSPIERMLRTAASPLSPPGGLGLLLGRSGSSDARSADSQGLWDAARARIGQNCTTLPSYAPGEVFADDEDGAYYALSTDLKVRLVELRLLQPVRTPRRLVPGKTASVLLSLARDGKVMPLKIDQSNHVVDGNHRYEVARRMGLTHVHAVLQREWPTPALERVRERP